MRRLFDLEVDVCAFLVGLCRFGSQLRTNLAVLCLDIDTQNTDFLFEVFSRSETGEFLDTCKKKTVFPDPFAPSLLSFSALHLSNPEPTTGPFALLSTVDQFSNYQCERAHT